MIDRSGQPLTGESPDSPRFLPMLQASKLDLAAECLYPWTSGVEWQDESGDAGTFGSAVHAFAHRYTCYLDGAPRPEVKDVAAEFELDAASAERLGNRATDLVILLEDQIVDWRQPEIPIGYNPETGLARDLRPDLRREPGEILLKLDLIIGHGGMVTVRDYKTGRRPVLRRVEDSRQVRLYALAAMKLIELGSLPADDCDRIRSELAWCEDSGIWIDHATFDLFDADAIEEEVRQLHRARLAPSAPRWGMHCIEHYCPIVARCPASKAYATMALNRAGATFPLAQESEHIANDDHARELLARIDTARKALDAAEMALRLRASKLGALDLLDGRHWGPRERPGDEDQWDIDKARPILAEHLGELAAEVVKTKTSASKSAMTAAIRKLVDREKDRSRGALKRRVGALLGDLRSAKALQRSAPYTSFGAFKKKTESEEENGE